MKFPTKARCVVYKLLDAVDPDDPNLFLQSQPGFEFRSTSYMGDMVFIKGPGEDLTDWPQDIGRVTRGPGDRWYVIGVRGVSEDFLDYYRFGVGKKAKTFASQEEAAMAIWLVWSRLPKREGGVLWHKRRKLREAYKGFYSADLNSEQPLPSDAVIVYNTLHQPWAKKFAYAMRRKYGINVWVDGTVSRGWKIMVHRSDGDRASRMFKNVS